MFGTYKIKIGDDLMDQVKKYSEIAGFSSPDEFIVHALEKEIEKLQDSDSDDEIKKRLEGLGYIS